LPRSCTPAPASRRADGSVLAAQRLPDALEVGARMSHRGARHPDHLLRAGPCELLGLAKLRLGQGADGFRRGFRTVSQLLDRLRSRPVRRPTGMVGIAGIQLLGRQRDRTPGQELIDPEHDLGIALRDVVENHAHRALLGGA